MWKKLYVFLTSQRYLPVKKAVYNKFIDTGQYDGI